MDRKFRLEMHAHPKIAQQNVTIHVGPSHNRLQLIPRLAPLEQQHRPFRVFVTVNNQVVQRTTPIPVPDDPIPPHLPVFDAILQPGTNVISLMVIAALPKGQKLPSGAEAEVEKITVHAFLAKPI
jgi:hypothetical protein